MNKRFNVLIVGAGITGLTIAALLAQSRYRDRLALTLVDAAPRPVFSVDDDVALRVSAIATGSAQLLQSIGAWSRIAASRASAYERMCVWDENGSADGAVALRFDAAEFAVPQLGFIVENVLLRHAVLEVLDGLEVELKFETKVDSFDVDLVIGADGARSFVRGQLGIKTRDYRYGQTAFVTHLQPSTSHRNTAWQRFMADGPLGMLPLADGRVSVVWSVLDASIERVQAAGDGELAELLSVASDRVLGDFTLAGPRGVFPLCARHAEQYVMPGVALIGDAAHAVHPLAGQGANLGLQDAATLADVIEQALANNEHPGDRPVLRRYERARKGENATMLHLMTGLNRLFTTDSALVRELRETGMRLFNASGPIRDHAVKVALGSSVS